MNGPNQPGSHGEEPPDGLVPEADKKKDMQPQGRREVSGSPGPESTRYGDGEKAGRCIDF